MLIKIKNKRGGVSIAIVLLVLMIIVLTIAALISFIAYSGKITKDISNIRIISNVYIEEEQLRFFMTNLLREKAKESWENGKNSYFLENVREKMALELDSMKKQEEERKEGVASFDYWYTDFEKNGLEEIKRRIKSDREDDFVLKQDGKKAELEMKNFKFVAESSDKSVKVEYIKDIRIEISMAN